MLSVKGESWIFCAKGSEQARAGLGSRGLCCWSFAALCDVPTEQIILEMICCWLCSMIWNRKMVPSSVPRALGSLGWDKGLQRSCCALTHPEWWGALIPAHSSTFPVAAGIALGPNPSVLTFSHPRITSAAGSAAC